MRIYVAVNKDPLVLAVALSKEKVEELLFEMGFASEDYSYSEQGILIQDAILDE